MHTNSILITSTVHYKVLTEKGVSENMELFMVLHYFIITLMSLIRKGRRKLVQTLQTTKRIKIVRSFVKHPVYVLT